MRSTHIALDRATVAEASPRTGVIVNRRATSTLLVATASAFAVGVLVATSTLAAVNEHARTSAAQLAPTGDALLRSEPVTSALAAALATPCATEDSHDCYWLGGSNGLGEHFVDVAGSTYPLPRER